LKKRLTAFHRKRDDMKNYIESLMQEYMSENQIREAKRFANEARRERLISFSIEKDTEKNDRVDLFTLFSQSL